MTRLLQIPGYFWPEELVMILGPLDYCFSLHEPTRCNSIFNIIAVIVNAVSPICMATCPRAAAVYLMQPIFWSAVTTHAVSYPVRSGILQSR
jgi:hypothetical protein